MLRHHGRLEEGDGRPLTEKHLHLSVDRERKRLSAITFPVRLCIFFIVLGDFISMNALIWSVLASISHLVTR